MIKTYDNLLGGRENCFLRLKILFLSPKNKLSNVLITYNEIMGFDKLVEVVAINGFFYYVIFLSAHYQTVPGPLHKSSWQVSKTADIVISTMSEGRFHSSLIRNSKFAY